MTLRDVLRKTAVSALALAGRVSRPPVREFVRKRVHVLCMHDVPPPALAPLRRLLGALRMHHTFISYTEAFERIRGNAIDRPYMAFSFDDGFKSALAAASVLEEFEARGCFFVCTSIVGEHDERKTEAFCRERLHKPVREFLGWMDLERLVEKGHEAGSHTVSHRDLAKLAADDLEFEIAGSYETLRRRLGETKHFAWPYGRKRHFSADAERIVFRTGFESCASAERGCHVSGTEFKRLITRDPVDPAWPVRESLYFIGRTSRLAAVRPESILQSN